MNIINHYCNAAKTHLMYTTYTTTHARTHARTHTRAVQRSRAACFPVSQLPKVDHRATRSEKENRKKYYLRKGRLHTQFVWGDGCAPNLAVCLLGLVTLIIGIYAVVMPQKCFSSKYVQLFRKNHDYFLCWSRHVIALASEVKVCNFQYKICNTSLI
jgi:hypothetical protein